MLLASFVDELAGTPGRQVRFALPGTVEEALKIATTVAQAEIQERSHESFYSDAAVPEITPAGRIRAPAQVALVGEARVTTRPHQGRTTYINSRQALKCTLRTRVPAILLGVMSVAEWVTLLEIAQLGDL
jgi:hypothetical protein